MVTQPTPKHDFLRSLHELLKPTMYLEIGVQSGTSMALASPTTEAIGIDPNPWPDAYPRLSNRAIQQIVADTSDSFFACEALNHRIQRPIDLAFIDGMHLIDNVLNDFIHCEEFASPDGVIVVDDVLPYSAAIATREPLPGDWTGDVWKLWPILRKWRSGLHITAVDVEPTGLLVIQGLDPDSKTDGPTLLKAYFDQIMETWIPVDLAKDICQPDPFTTRKWTLRPEVALAAIEEYRLKGN